MNPGRSGFRRDSDMRKYLLNLTSLSASRWRWLFHTQRARCRYDDDPPSRVAAPQLCAGTFHSTRRHGRLGSRSSIADYHGRQLWTDMTPVAELHIGSAAIVFQQTLAFRF